VIHVVAQGDLAQRLAGCYVLQGFACLMHRHLQLAAEPCAFGHGAGTAGGAQSAAVTKAASAGMTKECHPAARSIASMSSSDNPKW
jgi:hypothetical protein